MAFLSSVAAELEPLVSVSKSSGSISPTVSNSRADVATFARMGEEYVSLLRAWFSLFRSRGKDSAATV